MKKSIIFLLFLLLPYSIYGDILIHSQKGKILFLIQQGQHTQAIDLYQQYQKHQNEHDYELLHQMGLGILKQGFDQRDPEIQLLSLFGASIAANEEVYYILEESLKNPYPQIQLVALNALARFQNDRADQALLKALGSDELIIRLEAAYQLCLKKHPLAVSQIESLMYKTPKAILPIYPQLYAAIGNEKAIRHLRRLLNHKSDKVRTATILSIAQHQRDDLIPQLRQIICHSYYPQQEACAYTLGLLKDEKSLPKLKKLTHSSYPHVALAAQQALYRLGQQEAAIAIEQAAKKGDIFAINALAEIPEKSEVLVELLKHADITVRINATLALLAQGHLEFFSALKDILVRDKRNLTFTQTHSPGQAFKAWKVNQAATQLLKDDTQAYEAYLKLRENTLLKAYELSQTGFLELAQLIFNTQQNDLVPLVVELLEELDTPDAIQILKTYQQKVGAPFIRNYCNLALYRLKEEGPYGELLRQWVQSRYGEELIRFRSLPVSIFEYREKCYELTPEETSRLLIEAFQAFTINQDQLGIATLLETIRSGNQKNKYALAGLLIRAIE